jgi:hypothetical protein
MRVHKRNTSLAVAGLLAIGACSSAAKKKAQDDEWGTDKPVIQQDIPVQVQNHNWEDMVIYAVRNSTRSRLGQVTSMSTVRFLIPRTFMGTGTDIRLLADPIGSSQVFLTDALLLSPGVQIDFYIENHLPASSWTVGYIEEEQDTTTASPDSTHQKPHR